MTMFSGGAFSQYGFCHFEHQPLDTSAFEAFLAEVTAERVWLLELDAFSLASSGALSGAFAGAGFSMLPFSASSAGVTGGVRTLRFASQGYITKGTDTPAYTPYEPRLLVEQIRVRRSIAGREGIGGLTSLFAELRLVNADGAFDLLPENYALDGRRARILIGRAGDPLASFGLVFTGVVAENPEVEQETMRLALSDGSAKLAVPVQPTVYAGTGGLEGGADLAGKPKPLCWGHVFNVAPPLVDAAGLVYQVNAGAISDVPKVYDRGVELTKVAGAPAPGQYSVNAALGTFTLGGAPDGTVTADVLGDASSAGYVDRVADIVLRILAGPAALNSSEIDPASFANLNTDAGAEVGVWVGAEPRTVASVVDELLFGVGAFGGFSRYGTFTVGVLKAPTGAPAASFAEADIIGIRRVPRPSPIEPVVFRASVEYQRNYTVQNDLAAAVPAARVSFAAQGARTAEAGDTSIRSRYLLAKEYGPIAAHFAQQADGEDEAQRLFDLWSAGHAPYELTLRPKALTRDIGQLISATHPRFGFASGKDARVIGHGVEGSDVTLLVIA